MKFNRIRKQNNEHEQSKIYSCETRDYFDKWIIVQKFASRRALTEMRVPSKDKM
jgi:hypothetical protein